MVAYSFKRQFVDRILSGLGNYEWIDGEAPPPKRQTIRAVGSRRHARPGEVIQLYTAMRTKQCRRLGDGLCKRVEPVRISVHGNQIILPEQGRILDGSHLDEFARSDGFDNWAGMKAFWLAEHGEDLKRVGPWCGLLISWEAARG